jgi:uncharacterized protein YeeX (DUF496 family)
MEERTLAQLERDNYQNLSASEQESILQLAKTFNEMISFFNNEMPKQQKEALDLLLKTFGWYIRMDMSFNDLVPFIKVGYEAVDRYFIKKIRLSKHWLKQKSIKRFPHREKSIQLAFKAHRRGEYELSIPAFLILSEGIFREMSDADIYSKQPKKKTEFLNKLKSSKKVIPFLTHLVEAGINGEIIGLGFSNEEYLKYPHVLNRNRIIHGADYQYATKTNAYKALSQFEFIIDFVYATVDKRIDI